MEKVKGKDLYQLLEVEPEADEKTIKKAYRKKALTCHPDKNPDNKDAVALFHELSDALEVLTDPNSRKAYDTVLKARKANELRIRALDGKRRKLKDQLEQREHEAKFEEQFTRKSDEEKLAMEIERLRREGSKQLEEEQLYMREQLAKEAAAAASGGEQHRGSEQPARVKVKWSKSDDSPYTSESLERIFSKYGTVSAVVINKKKGGSALVEFNDLSSAKMAATIETGFVESPLKVKALFSEAPSLSIPVQATHTDSRTIPQDNDFESLVLRKLRQEEERKRLIAQMIAEDENS